MLWSLDEFDPEAKVRRSRTNKANVAMILLLFMTELRFAFVGEKLKSKGSAQRSIYTAPSASNRLVPLSILNVVCIFLPWILSY